VNLWNVGPVAANASATLILTAQATAAAGATVLDSVVVASLVYDPYKLNNFAEWKTVINPSPTLSIVWGARTNAFAWSGAATNFVLKGATNLTPPVVWVTVTNPAPILTNGEYWLPLPTNGLHFFILTTPH
jgi:hypothetical protein